MKKLLFSLFGLLAIVACEDTSNTYTLSGTMEGEMAEGTKVFLKKTDEKNQPVDVDTTSIQGGTFAFKGTSTEPELHYLFFENTRGNIPVILEEGSIEVSAHKDSLAFATIEGTPQNEMFTGYLEASRALSKKAMTMNEDMRNAASARDTATMNSLRDEYFELQEEARENEIRFAEENPNSLISALIIERALSSGQMDVDKASTLYDSLTEEIKNSAVGKRIAQLLEKTKKTAIGSKAPNFKAPTPEGGELSLEEAMGKVTIVDFWAAWCKPCRAENPNVVKVYEKYKDRGLSILGVSLDRSEDAWKKAIEEDGLTWNHVSNVEYFDEIAALYNVNAIPATFILDENGVIVAKNLRGAALEEKIGELLQ